MSYSATYFFEYMAVAQNQFVGSLYISTMRPGGSKILGIAGIWDRTGREYTLIEPYKKGKKCDYALYVVFDNTEPLYMGNVLPAYRSYTVPTGSP